MLLRSPENDEPMNSAAFSPDGKLIVTASSDKTARVWDVNTGKEILSLVGHTGYVYFAAFNRDGKRIVTASSDKTARVWDFETGKPLLVLHGHTDSVNAVAFSPNSQRIVTASKDQIAYMGYGHEPAAHRLPRSRGASAHGRL